MAFLPVYCLLGTKKQLMGGGGEKLLYFKKWYLSKSGLCKFMHFYPEVELQKQSRYKNSVGQVIILPKMYLNFNYELWICHCEVKEFSQV